MAITMDGIFVNGQKATFRPEDILTGDASAYTEEIGAAVETWMEENVTGGEQVTDTTLTLPGVPADAEVTGNKFDELNEDLNNEIDANNDVIKNVLYDTGITFIQADIADGYYVSSQSGIIVQTTQQMSASGYVHVYGLQMIGIANGIGQFAYYDGNKRFISGVAVSSLAHNYTEYNIPDNAVFARFTVYTPLKSTVFYKFPSATNNVPQGAVRYDIAQNLSDTHKNKARANIDAADNIIVQEIDERTPKELVNFCDVVSPVDDYYISRTTGSAVANTTYAYYSFQVENGKAYYYADFVPYFAVIDDGNGTLTNIATSTYNRLSGNFVAPYDGELRITCLKSEKKKCVLSNNPLALVNSNQNELAITNTLVPPYTFVVGSNQIYRRIRDAVAEAIKYADSNVIIKTGTYDLLSEFADEIADLEGGSTTKYGNKLENGVHLFFEAGAVVTAIYTGNSANVTTYFNPFYTGYNGGGFTIENLHIKCQATRYCVHDELAGQDIYTKNIYKNCCMEIDSVNAPVNGYVQCIGGGCGKHTYVDIDGCIFKSKRAENSDTPLVSYHNGDSADAMSYISVKNSYFADKGTFRCTHYGASTKVSTAIVQNCSLGLEPIIRQEASGGTAPENFELLAFNNEIRA